MSAETVAADHVITRNKRDFRSAQFSVLTPEEWLALESGAGLAEIYNWFTEGFETKDLQEARALLDSLT